MGLYTSDRLKAMFQQSKERKQKEKEQHKQEKQQQYQLLCRQADELLKKVQEDAKKKKMEELQALAQKTSQNQNKQQLKPSFTVSRLPIYHTNLVERNPGERDLYTLEELKNIETLYPNEFGRINWELWDKLVKETRQQIEQATKDYKESPKERWDNHRYTVYVYNDKLQLIGEYASTCKCARALGINSKSVGYWIEQGRPHKKLGITFLKHRLML